jgi:hypothetical protein
MNGEAGSYGSQVAVGNSLKHACSWTVCAQFYTLFCNACLGKTS